MPKTHARFLWLRLLCFFWSLIVIICIAIELFVAYSLIHFGADPFTWGIYVLNIVVLGGCILFFLVRTLQRLRAWKRFEQQRKAAAQGEQSLLAMEHPVPDPKALPLPSTIIHHPSRFPFLRRASILLVASVSVGIMLFNTLSTATTVSSLADFLIEYLPPIMVALLVVVFICKYIYLYAREYRRIVVTEDGLHVSGRLTRARYIAWKDVRLLALVTFRNQMGQLSNQLEVSSVNEIISLPWPQPTGSSIAYFNDPSCASQEYEQSIDKAISVITARTGLSLYDLRKR